MLSSKSLAATAVATPLYVEDVFSTYLYTGNSSTQTITNGIDLSGKGGLIWSKNRGVADNHYWIDSARFPNEIYSNATNAQADGGRISSLNSTGYTLGANAALNQNANSFVSWTFRKAPKFFDVVTYTGTGDGTTNFTTGAQNVSHSLNASVGLLIIKTISTVADWQCFTSVAISGNNAGQLNKTNGLGANGTNQIWSTGSTSFQVRGAQNLNGVLYVAYLFAHNPASDGFIQCGNYVGNGSTTGPVVTLGWEPQWLLIKNASGTGNWQIIDNMRGMPVGSTDETLQANLTNVESSVDYVSPTATGFQVTSTSTEVNTNTSTYLYVAIRRPMKTPTSGTSVFSVEAVTPSSAQLFNTGFPVDTTWGKWRTSPGNSYDSVTVYDRLRGYQLVQGAGSNNKFLLTASTATEASNIFINTLHYGADRNNGILYGDGASSLENITYAFRRAPGFFDIVAYTGNSSVVSNHSLGVIPELWIVRGTNRTSRWFTALTSWGSNRVYLNSNSAIEFGPILGSFTTTTFTQTTGAGEVVGPNIVYLFATLPGISKVGSYTGTGTTLQIDCGFTTGPRFVMIKRWDSTGDWYVWDTARGIITGNDPYLLFNSVNPEVTTTDYIDPLASGFEISSTAPAEINASGGSYIYLAIA